MSNTEFKSNFLKGAANSTALVIGAAPLGVIFGALVVAQGLPLWFAVIMSAFVFAGSAQFVVVGLMAVNTPISVILLTTFIINIRHALYSIAMVPQLKKESLLTRALVGFGLTDESFAVVSSRFHDKSINIKYYYFGSMAFFYSAWVIATFAGAYLGNQFPQLKSLGLEITMIVTFIGMVTPQLKTKPMNLGVACTAMFSIIFHPLPYNLGLVLSTLFGVAIAYAYSKKRSLAYE